MEIDFKTHKLEKTFVTAGKLGRLYGKRMEKIISSRLAILSVAYDLSEVPPHPPVRRHQLTGTRREQFAVDLVHPYRLIFEANHDPVPRKEDGGINLKQVIRIRILEVVDYH